MVNTYLDTTYFPVYAIVIATCLAFIAAHGNEDFLYKYGTSYADTFQRKNYYQLLTHMFAHAGIAHLFFNVYGLFWMGTAVVDMYGGTKFLLIYFLSGVIAAIITDNLYEKNGRGMEVNVGASGAVMGLVGAAIAASGGFDRIVRTELIIVVLINVIPTRRGVNYAAHLFGVLSGFVIGFIMLRLG